jgi:hypothetical protein
VKIEHTETFGWEAALRGMRNPFNSHHKSDSSFEEGAMIGLEDIALSKKLIRRGADHRKFLRFITITCDITAPRYFWTELDTYKVGTVRNSCSTMHGLLKGRYLTKDDFAHGVDEHAIYAVNKWLKNGDLTMAKVNLPEGYLMKSTYLLNYEVALNIYMARRKHRLFEWKQFCSWIEKLPCMSEFIGVLL